MSHGNTVLEAWRSNRTPIGQCLKLRNDWLSFPFVNRKPAQQNHCFFGAYWSITCWMSEFHHAMIKNDSSSFITCFTTKPFTPKDGASVFGGFIKECFCFNVHWSVYFFLDEAQKRFTFLFVTSCVWNRTRVDPLRSSRQELDPFLYFSLKSDKCMFKIFLWLIT